MNTIDPKATLQKIGAAKQAGYNSSQILDELQKSPDQSFNQTVATNRKMWGDDETFNKVAVDLNYGMNPLTNPSRLGEDVATKFVKDTGNALLTGTVGNVASGVGQMISQGQGNDAQTAYQQNSQPMDVPFFGNINPRSKTPLALTGQAAQLASTFTPVGQAVSNTAANALELVGSHSGAVMGHIIAPLVGESMRNIGGAAVNGFLHGFGDEAQQPGATWEGSAKAGGTGALTTGLFQSGIEFVSKWPQIKQKFLQMATGVSSQELEGIDPQEAQNMMKDPKKMVPVYGKAKTALTKAQAFHSNAYDEASKAVLNPENGDIPWSNTVDLKKKVQDTLGEYGINLQDGSFLPSPDDPKNISASFLGTPFEGDKAAQGRIKYWASKVFTLPEEVDTASVNAVKKLIGNGVDFSLGNHDADNALGKSIWGATADQLTTDVPEMEKVNADYSQWAETRDTIGSSLNNLKKGEAFLANSMGKNKTAIFDALQQIETDSGVPFLNSLKAANFVSAIQSGKAGPMSRAIGMIMGGGIGGTFGGFAGAAGGAMVGRQFGKAAAPAINQAMGTSLLGSLIDNPMGTQISTEMVNPAVQGMITSLTASKTPSQTEKNYGEFAQGFRQRYPTASDREVNDAFQKLVNAGTNSLASAPGPQIAVDQPVTQESFADFAKGFKGTYPNAPEWLVKRTYDNIVKSNTPLNQ